MVSLARTAYLVSGVSYLAFLFLEWLRPGFVTNVFTPHLFLAAAVLCGVLWGRGGEGKMENGKWRGCWPLAFFFGLFFSGVVWMEGRPLEEFRILTSIAGFFTPFILFYLLRSKF